LFLAIKNIININSLFTFESHNILQEINLKRSEGYVVRAIINNIKSLFRSGEPRTEEFPQEKSIHAQSASKTTQETLSKEEALERSWEFLTNITERVALLPPDAQERILTVGRKLREAQTNYNHDPKPKMPIRNTKKEAMIRDQSGGHGTTQQQ